MNILTNLIMNYRAEIYRDYVWLVNKSIYNIALKFYSLINRTKPEQSSFRGEHPAVCEGISSLQPYR